MKKIISVLLVSCMLFTVLVAMPNPVFAASTTSSSDEALNVLGGVFIGLGVLLVIMIPVIIFATADEEKAAAKSQQDYMTNLQNSNNYKLGRWEFDDMLLEMGKPTDVTEGEKIKIAVYDKRATNVESNTEYEEGTFLYNATSVSKSNSYVNGVVWTYSFDKKTKKLLKWRYERYENNALTVDNSGITTDGKPIIKNK